MKQIPFLNLNIKGAIILLPFLFFTFACTKKAEQVAATNAKPTTLTSQELLEKGKLDFQLNCVSCHGSDPTKDGPIGPALSGSSFELIEARVMRTAYPEGYKPKRTSGLMVALPHLKNELPALHAYLNSFALGASKAKPEELCEVSASSDCVKSSK